jgi:hypothetical protein
MLATIVPVATSEPLTLLKIAQRVQAEHGKPMSKMIVARVP